MIAKLETVFLTFNQNLFFDSIVFILGGFEMNKLELEGHRCFKIPKQKLDLFLVALNMNFSSQGLIKHTMECMFQSEKPNYYDVIVARYGSYPFVQNELDKFVGEL